MLDLVLEKGRTPIALFGWYEPAGAGNQLAQGKPASTGKANTHAANRTPSSFETHGANSTCSPSKKKMAPTALPFNGAKPITIQIIIQHLK